LSIRYLPLNNEWTSVILNKAPARILRFPVAHIVGVLAWCFIKVKAILVPAWTGPAVSRSLRLQNFKKVVPASFTPRKYPWYSFLLDDESTPGPQCSWEDTIWNRACDLPACIAVPQPAAPKLNPHGILLCDNIIMEVNGSESGGFCIGGAEPLGSITKTLIN